MRSSRRSDDETAVSPSENDLPALYRVADRSSLEAQQWFLRATVFRLTALLGAAFFGLFEWTHERSPTDWAGVIAAICFFAALLVEIYLLKGKPERTWYEGRAAAESVKTLTWRYMMRADPFSVEEPLSEVDGRFLHRLSDVLGALKDIDLVTGQVVGEQISPTMRTIRASSLERRMSTYESSRVCEQQEWYMRKACWNRDRAVRWTQAMLSIEAAGIVAALLKAVGTIRGDVLGLVGAIVAAMTAWLQTKQHRTLAAAYGVTALELASVRSRIPHQRTEAEWAKFVSDAEEAFSREHTLWKASRGVRPSGIER